MGYFLEIEPDAAPIGANVYVGCLRPREPTVCTCPNCGEPMFPIFSVHRSLPEMPVLELYDEKGFVTFDVCPSCSHSLENYFTRRQGGGRIAGKGYIDGAGPSNFIDKPFESRAVTLIPIADEAWDTDEFLQNYLDRKLLNGVLHQIGGKKMRKERVPLQGCLCCGGELTYLATIDYDDLNVPLYEDAEPRSLVIGDMQSLNVMVCLSCSALNYGITTG